MFQTVNKIKVEYLAIFTMAIFAGFLISIYDLSVLFLLVSVLFILASFKYFNQVLLLLILYIPFQIALNITAGIDLASGRVLILYMFVIWIIKSLAEKNFVIRLNLQTLLIGIFLMLAVFSMLQAQDMERSIRKILVFLSIFPLYFILTSFSNRIRIGHCLAFPTANGSYVVENKNNFILKIIKMSVIGGLIISLIGIVQFALQFIFGIDLVIEFWSKYVAFIFYGETFGAEVLSNPSWLVNVSGATVLRVISLFPDPHMLSFYLGFIIPIVLSLVLFEKKYDGCHSELSSKSVVDKGLNSFQFLKQVIWKIVRYCGYRKRILNQVQNNKNIIKKKQNGYFFLNSKILHIVLFVMLLTELLTFSRGGYIGMIVGISTLIILGWKYLSDFKRGSLGIFFSMFVFIALVTNQSVVSRFLSSFNISEGSNIERIKNWQQGWEVFSNNIWTGVGIGNYSIYLYPTIEYRTPVYAHNLYLDIGAEMGVLALIAWLLLIGVTMWQLYRFSRKTRDNFQRAISLGLIGSLTWFSVHSIFDTPIYSPTILAIFVIVLSLSVMILTEAKTCEKSDY